MGADTPYQYDAGRDQKQKVGVLGSTARRVTAQVSGCEFDAREDTVRRLRARNKKTLLEGAASGHNAIDNKGLLQPGVLRYVGRACFVAGKARDYDGGNGGR
eukprot:scaffold7392_cov157-Isochrysis_galbana.AAC.3